MVHTRYRRRLLDLEIARAARPVSLRAAGARSCVYVRSIPCMRLVCWAASGSLFAYLVQFMSCPCGYPLSRVDAKGS